jgi:sterol desaturase/sphingolipid hydroxylase (fatty acid hydroxylase superfamily)
MTPETHLQDITRTIQLAVAPVFLLLALGSTLAVLTTRLARVVDRARRLEARLGSEQDPPDRAALVEEVRRLAHRARLIHWALTAATSAAILVCLLVAVAFLGYLFGAEFGGAMAILFILAISAYVVALLLFLREIFHAIDTLRFSLAPVERESKKGP